MIRVEPQPEPDDFDVKVRQKGLAWLADKGIPRDQPLPDGKTLKAFWRDCLDELHSSYGGICAYLAIFIERVAGATSTDHFAAKSQVRAELAYEWANYRLACSTMNSRKGVLDDVLDPFDVQTGWFRLELVSGHIFPDPLLDTDRRRAVKKTIDRLRLDAPDCREMRARRYEEYRRHSLPPEYLRAQSPFIYAEALRQDLL